jgi:hypothetical protein
MTFGRSSSWVNLIDIFKKKRALLLLMSQYSSVDYTARPLALMSLSVPNDRGRDLSSDRASSYGESQSRD